MAKRFPTQVKVVSILVYEAYLLLDLLGLGNLAGRRLLGGGLGIILLLRGGLLGHGLLSLGCK